ncbi:uncharacterized protein LOC112567287 [Pomacea canaliculata]|uniref:uncharacterized protein LOC112567287 n=1 Tax=Pomacea canaliculata TaxID=400727 RepID=UPI000D7360FB|nr:uncharacterized protein LOC112567287 [Pomacea canaliculata]
MSGSQQRGRQGGTHGRGQSSVEEYLHVVTHEEAALLTASGNQFPFQEIKQKTGADVLFDPYPSPVPDTKLVIIHGSRSQIEAAVRLINKKTGTKESLSTQAQTFWLQWVEEAFPELDSRAYFLPPVYVNRVPMTRQSFASQNVLVLQQAGQAGQLAPQGGQSMASSFPQPPIVQDSDVRDDTAMQRVLLCLQKMSEENKEVLLGISQLEFEQYLSESCYTAAAAKLSLPANLPPALPRKWKQGDFDVLLIHRHYGLVVCEVKSVGHTIQQVSISPQDADNIRKKLKVAVSQLDKAEAMLSHLVSDIAPGLRITKTIGLPNLTGHQAQQAISSDPQLIKDLCRCLGTQDPADIPGLCLCSDQLSDQRAPWDVSSNVLRELGNWWQRRVAGSGPDSHMTSDVYKNLAARFSGPATTVVVPYTSPPRMSLKTLGQAVSHTGECYTALMTLYPEQVHLLNMAPCKLFVAGPPGTGKSVVLLLMGAKWLLLGVDVYILSVAPWSRAANIMLCHLLKQSVNIQQVTGVSPGQVHFLQYDFTDKEQVEKAVKDLSQVGETLYLIIDEATPELLSGNFQKFVAKLRAEVLFLNLWAAGCSRPDIPYWQVEYLTRPLRSPPAIVREVEQDSYFTDLIIPYSKRDVPDHTDGPTVKRVCHRGQGHSRDVIADCVTCGREVASILRSLRVGEPVNVTTTSATATSTSGGTAPPGLQWRDVLVLAWSDFSDYRGMARALGDAGIPAQVMKDDDLEDMATARSDVVWLASRHHVRGLERKVIVCINDPSIFSTRFELMSRCTSQLVIISTERQPPKQ